MLSTQQILQSVTDMQANAQSALPVIPNNGNPAGANNMPHKTMPLPRNTGIIPPHMQQPSPMAERYPWLKQSSSMDNIRNFLSQRRGMFQQQQPQQGQMQQVPQENYPTDLPVIPLRSM